VINQSFTYQNRWVYLKFIAEVSLFIFVYLSVPVPYFTVCYGGIPNSRIEKGILCYTWMQMHMHPVCLLSLDLSVCVCDLSLALMVFIHCA
jgi:hypothetical protein